MKESTLTAKIQKYLKARGDVWFFKVHGGPMQRAGVPDLLLCFRGRFVALEIKADAAVTPLQERTIRQIGEVGGVATVVRSVEEVQAVLESL